MMKVTKTLMFHICQTVVHYGKMYVTTEGQMFKATENGKIAVEEAVRTKNMTIDDINDYIGYITLTEEMFTEEKVKQYAKDSTKFSELFDGARIPKAWGQVTKEPERETEEKVKHSSKAKKVASLLLGDTNDDTDPEAEAKAKAKLLLKK